MEVQVPIRPIGASDLQIQAYVHRQGDAVGIAGVPVVYKTVAYHFNHTAPSPALPRNIMLTARIQIQSTTPTTEIDNSLFTINASGHKVRFSKGNLKQNGPSSSFHQNQYDRSASQNDTERDLFQWNVVETDPMAAAGWRVLESAEWDYLVNTRPVEHRFAKASVAGVNGLILFPDSYVQPSGIPLNHVNAASMDYGANYSDFNNYTAEQWAGMEAAGAIFLPAAHNGGGEGHYWSFTTDVSNTARRLYFSVNELYATNAEPQANTCSIRMVKNE